MLPAVNRSAPTTPRSRSNQPVATGPRPFVIGLGHWLRRDDSVGLWVASQLQARCGEDAAVACAAGPLSLIALWTGHPLVVLVDAMRSGAAPGTLRCLGLPELAEFPLGGSSSHGIEVRTTLAMAEALGVLPAELKLYAIEAADLGYGEGLSDPVAQTAQALVSALAEGAVEPG